MGKRCYGCMQEKQSSPKCEHCGYDERTGCKSHQLPPGTVVGGQYILGRVLGQGGFGITYIGWDSIMNQRVAVKEYYPTGYAGRDTRRTTDVTSYDAGTAHAFADNKRRFLREAESLAKLWNIPQIVRVLRHFEENGTAYIAMEYAEGEDLRNYMKKLGRPMTVEELKVILGPILEALAQVHKAELVHRDISPDNIMVLPDGTGKLLDFGAARFVENANAEADRNTSTQAILKHGFAPPEQYRSHGALGPWTDIYAMCATVYFCLTGKVPPESMSRMMGENDLDLDSVKGLNRQQKTALKSGMELQPKNRIQSAQELHRLLFGQPLDEAEIARRLAEEEKRRAEEAKKKAQEDARRRHREEELQKTRKRTESPQQKPARKGSAGKILAAAAAGLALAAGVMLISGPKTQEPEIQVPAVATEASTATTVATVPETTEPAEQVLEIATQWNWEPEELGTQMPALAVPAEFDPAQIHWTTSDPDVATVAQDGTLTSVGYGSTVITARYDYYVGHCKLTVNPQPNVTCTYMQIGPELTITGVEGKIPAEVILPSQIDGKPVTGIGNKAFENRTGITSIYIPEGITGIGESAFYDCIRLKKITFPKTMTTIGNLAFYGCDSLVSVTLPEGLTTVASAVFRGCDRLERVVIPEGVTAIEGSAFFYCEALTEVQLPSTLKSIGYGAFFNCSRLASIELPVGLLTIEDEAFGSCENLAELNIPAGVTSIGRLAFYKTPWLAARTEEFVICGDGILLKYNGTAENVVIPNSVKKLSDAFSKSTTVKTVVIPESVVTIGAGAFYGCKNLTEITIGENVTYIGNYAFTDCTSLTEITIPYRVKEVAYEAFVGCTKLEVINLPRGCNASRMKAPESCTVNWY